MQRPSRTKFVTFYSYKGGVGRTLALSNVAWQCALQGKRVVILDFDLEAPGISHIKPFRDCVEKHFANPEKGGLLDLICKYKEHFSKYKNAPPTLSMPDFYSATLTKNEEDSFPDGAAISIIPAGREDDEYNRNLYGIRWEEFYEKGGGREFFLQLRDVIRYQFDNPDLVLIDSRTGLSETGGICTSILPDKVVLLMLPNEQNTQGCKKILSTIEEFSQYRMQVSKQRPDKSLTEWGEIKTLVVATFVPMGDEYQEKAGSINLREEELGRNFDLLIPFIPYLVFDEVLPVKDYYEKRADSMPIVERYVELYEKIFAIDQINQFNQEASKPSPDLPELKKSAKEILDEALSDDEIANVYYRLGSAQRDQGNDGEAFENFQRIILLFRGTATPLKAAAFREMARLKKRVGEIGQALSYFQKAQKIYLESGLEKKGAYIMGEMAQILWDQGKTSESLKLYDEELEIYQKEGDDDAAASTKQDIARRLLQLNEDNATVLTLLTDAEETFQRIGNENAHASVLLDKATIYRDQKQYQVANELLQKALSHFENTENEYAIAKVKGQLAFIESQIGDQKTALDLHKKVIEIFENLGDQIASATQKLYLVDLFLNEKDLDNEEQHGNEAGQVHQKMKGLDYAEQLAKECKQTFEKLSAKFHLPHVVERIGKIHEKRGQIAAAAENYRLAIQIAQKTNQMNYASILEGNHGEFCKKSPSEGTDETSPKNTEVIHIVQ